MIKKYRIKKNEEFSRIISRKRSKAGDGFVLYFDDAREEHSRIGISVSKKLGNAVIRNRIKRQIRMMCSHIFDFEGSRTDLIIIARNRYLDRTFEQNQRELEKLIKSSIIYKNEQGE
ncbi:MAG: ribonuclease P protein component [Erysipelotrichaceae bacterium]|nr:ribonuclease P protein component [Erysipelotrichaceae bacterium]